MMDLFSLSVACGGGESTAEKSGAEMAHIVQVGIVCCTAALALVSGLEVMKQSSS